MSELLCWRLVLAHRADEAFNGEGAARRGGRWNLRGTRVVYSSDSRSLAALEILANVDERHRLIQIAWCCMAAELPGDAVEKPARLPDSWREFPHTVATQEFGTRWVQEARSLALRVPSAVVPGEFNYLINPAHPDFKRVKLGKPEPFSFDPRIAK